MPDQSAATTGAVTVKLGYRPPYDWDAVLAFLRARAIPGIEAVSRTRYARTIAIGDGRGTVEVEPAVATASRPPCDFPNSRACRRSSRACAACSISPPIRWRSARISARTRFWRRWWPLGRGCGFPAPGTDSSSRCAAILGQQITVSAATRLAGKLVAHFGDQYVDPIAREHGMTHVFPTPRQLAEADLAAIGMPQARRQALASLAAAVVADPLIFGPRRSLEEAIAQLRSLAGIGEWTAQYIAMREMREPDAFPAADIGLLRAMADREGVRPSPAELLVHAERWRPWRAYAALHLWASEAHATPATAQVLHDQQAA